MVDELRPEILAPIHRRRRAILIALGCCSAGAALLAVAGLARETTVVQQREVVRTELVPVRVPVPVVIQTPPPARASELSLMFTVAGTTYVKIADLDDVPKHGKLRLIDDDGTQVAIASVAVQDLPAAYQAWQQRSVNVDVACFAKVTGFAVVSRLLGDADYSDAEGESWTAKNVFDSGERVLAARLDACPGGKYARDVKLSYVTKLRELAGRDDLGKRARALVASSTLSREAQRVWEGEYEQSGTWYDASDTRTITRVLQHPVTGTIWVSVHVRNDERCGEPGGNVWGLFRVAAGDKLEQVQLRANLLEEIEEIIDIEGDDQLELIGTSWMTTHLMRADSEKLQSLGVAFYGCGC